jgi:hypothetical protein
MLGILFAAYALPFLVQARLTNAARLMQAHRDLNRTLDASVRARASVEVRMAGASPDPGARTSPRGCGVRVAAVRAHTNPKEGEAGVWLYVSHKARVSAHAPSELTPRASAVRANDVALLPLAGTTSPRSSCTFLLFSSPFSLSV